MPGARRGGRADGRSGGAGGPDGSDSAGEADAVDGPHEAGSLVSSVISGVGAVIAAATLGEWVVLAATGGTLVPAGVLVQAALNLLPGLALVFAGVVLGRRLETDRHARVVGWCLGALAVSLGANAVLMVAFPPDPPVFAVGWSRTAAAFGAVTGVTVGFIEARAIERSLAAERAQVRAAAAERRRDRLAYLNSLLRHEVLNAANVVIGHASYVVEHDDVDDVTGERFAAVERQGQRLADVVSDVRLLTEAIDAEPDLEPVDLVGVLETEVAVLRDRYESVAVETEYPDEALVLADDLLGHAFENLLDNAVQHNESGRPEVALVVECVEDRVVVEVADDGPGIPPAERAAMFERETAHNHGLGLFVVRTLVERYDGAVELAETGADGSRFTVELPQCSDADSHPTATDATGTADGSAGFDDDGARGNRDTADEDGRPTVS